MRSLTPAVLLTALVATPIAASNQLEEAILFEHRQAIAALTAAKKAIQDHAARTIKRRRAWLAYYEGLRESFNLQSAALPKLDAGAKAAIEHATLQIERIDNMLRLAPELFKSWVQRKELEIAERQELIDKTLPAEAAISTQETERYIETLEMRRDVYIP